MSFPPRFAGVPGGGGGLYHTVMVPLGTPNPPPPSSIVANLVANSSLTPSLGAAQTPFISINKDVPTGPPVTVFVGNITERAQDAMIRHLLTTCGPVLSWKRVQGATGKLQAFGFAEYGNPDAGLRAIRILHDWTIADKKLVVKVDAKTSEILNEYKAQRRRRVKGIKVTPLTSGELSDVPESEYMDDSMLHDDNITKERIDAILMDHAKEMNSYVILKDGGSDSKKGGGGSAVIVQTGPKESLDDVEMEDGKRDIIHREIDKFRETMKIREAEKEEEKKKREVQETGGRGNSRSGSGGGGSDENRKDHRESSARRSSHKRSLSRSRSYSPKRRSRRSRERRDRTPVRKSQQEVWKEREKEEEEKERKKNERKSREKENSYQCRLRKWETREVKMRKERERERGRERKVKEENERNGKKVKEFLEDYSDSKDDEKYYRGRELDRRFHERLRESGKDSEDRLREKEEIEELKNVLRHEGFDGDTASEVKRRMEMMMNMTNTTTSNSVVAPAAINNSMGRQRRTIRKASPLLVQLDDEDPYVEEIIVPLTPPQPPLPEEDSSPIAVEEPTTPLNSSTTTETTALPPPPPLVLPIQLQPMFSFSKASSLSSTTTTSVTFTDGKKKLNVSDVFNQEDDEIGGSVLKKRKPLPHSLPPSSSTTSSSLSKQRTDESSSKASSSSEEKRKHIKALIEKIPTDKADLFSYSIDWDLVDNSLMEKRIRPWVNKKIAEYIGEPEPTLTDFICSKVLAGSSPKAVLDDVQMVLDEEAEVFVVKMWRLLIYEIENKKHKSYVASSDD